MTEKVTVIDSLERVLKWWWDSFEMLPDRPENGGLRFIVASAIGIVSIILASTLFASIVDSIISIRWHLLIAALIAFAYFQTPKYTWTEVVDYIKTQAKSVFGDNEQ